MLLVYKTTIFVASASVTVRECLGECAQLLRHRLFVQTLHAHTSIFTTNTVAHFLLRARP